MGVKIAAAAIMPGRLFGQKSGAIKLSALAAIECLQKSSIAFKEIDIIINTGVYRDEHIGEPSIASLIQGTIDQLLGLNTSTTFSFDLNAGGNGVLTAIRLASQKIYLGQAQHILITSGDSNPDKRWKGKFYFATSAGALILSKTDDQSGLKKYVSYQYPEHASAFQSKITWEKTKWFNFHRYRLKITQNQEFLANSIESVKESLKDFEKKAGFTDASVDVVLSSIIPEGFYQAMKNTSLANKMPNLTHEYSGIHSAGLIASWVAAQSSEEFRESQSILFISVAAGIIVTVALWENEKKDG